MTPYQKFLLWKAQHSNSPQSVQKIPEPIQSKPIPVTPKPISHPISVTENKTQNNTASPKNSSPRSLLMTPSTTPKKYKSYNNNMKGNSVFF